MIIKPFPKGTLLTTHEGEDATWRSNPTSADRLALIEPGEVMIALGDRVQQVIGVDFDWDSSVEWVQHPRLGPGWVTREGIRLLPTGE